MSVIYSLKNVVKSRVVDGAGFSLVVPSVEIKAQENVALVGHSGCGKSTLLDMMALALHPDSADEFSLTPDPEEIYDVDTLWKKKKQNVLAKIRKQHIGYVLQQGGLLPYLTVRENIELPRKLMNMPDDDSTRSIARVMGIHRQLDKLPGLLSAGERQRVAFTRALSHRPSILLADEPTASLDPITARKIMAVVMELVKGLKITMITASHDWAHVYKMDLRSLHQEAEVIDNGNVYQSTFRD
ncbi:MAG: ABC transporter ATP-binding protein [Gammaproteobacteria bacterium]|jgi:putative ABC transport system ATP-binding protein|nr:ABC transporter ATP-binding protein [Gammaproteobacteria bacterium]MBT3724808.1 ABC transporter ATP-binding protein [Gammaproteobacteria bacterium]MBT4075812.1 ABC transporter ATP-binding protein [Gammaproteobacteria bacterium]MBT4193816.1 ABC transporter ATP-binding protein [Gammaproteobacteria bacterium]MBT4452142.1 ABC transporter ATP-binding protein [Gammaproteobacteria bacterium]